MVLLAVLAVSFALAARGPEVLIHVTGGVQGFLDQCGCARYPLGGFDRRAGHLTASLRDHPRASRILVDAGNFSDAPGPGGDVRTRAIVEAMNKLGYAASAVGERDLAGGAEKFRALTAHARFPFVSTNLVRESSRKHWLPPSVILRAGALRIGILAVTRYNPGLRVRLADGDHVVTVDPTAAVERALAEVRRECDIVVLLAALPIEDARILARRAQGIDLVLGSHGGRLTAEPIREGSARILYVGDQGKYIGEFDVFRASTDDLLSFAARVVELGEGVRPDPRLEAFVVERLAEAQEAERLAQATTGNSDGERGKSFVGSGACTACHADIVSDWSATRHAHAWATLKRDPSTFRLSCVSCHVTGHGQPGGFVDEERTPHLVDVGCESCHGPAADHLSQPERPYGAVTLATCTSCHTAEMDPAFNYYQDLRLVSHEEVTTPAPAR